MNTFQKSPGEKIRNNDPRLSEDERDWVSEAGGFVRWCPECGVYDSPNGPCFCGTLVIKMEGKFWSSSDNESGEWVDSIAMATHFYPGSKAKFTVMIGVLRGVYGGAVYASRWGDKKLFVTCSFCGEKHEWFCAPEGKEIPVGFGETDWSCDSNKCRKLIANMRKRIA